MKKILIVNLTSESSSLNIIQTVAGITEKNEDYQIGLLTFSDCQDVSKLLENIKYRFYIHNLELKKIVDNKIFSPFSALTQLHNDLQKINETQWDQVFNLSNHPMAKYVSSMINSKSISGQHYKNGHCVFDKLATELQNNPSLSELTGINNSQNLQTISSFYHDKMELLALNTNSDSNKLVFSKIRKLKETYKDQNKKQVVAIEVRPEKSENSINFQTAIEVIEKIRLKSDLIPIIVCNTKDNCQSVIEKINQNFNHQVIIVYADLLGISSVLMNADYFIGTSFELISICDTYEVPSIYLTSQSNFKTNYSFNAENLVLHSNRLHFPLITGEDIYYSIQYLTGKNKVEINGVSTHLTVYEVCSFNNHLILKNIAGRNNDFEQLNWIVGQCFVGKLSLAPNINFNLYRSILIAIEESTVTTWLMKEKGDLSESVRATLSALRSISSIQNGKGGRKDLVNSLDLLFEIYEHNTLSSIIINSLKNKLEAIDGSDPKMALENTNNELLNFKSNLQILTSLFSEVAEFYTEIKKQKLAGKNLQII